MGAPTRSLSPPDRRQGLRGAPGGPGGSPGCEAGPRRSTLRPPGCGPREEPSAPTGQGGAQWGGVGWSWRSTPSAGAPSSSGSARVSQSVGPCAPAARRGRVGTARKPFPTTPTPSRTRWLRPRFQACRLNPFPATRRRERLFSPLHSGPNPPWGTPRSVFYRLRGATHLEKSLPEGVK